MEPKRITFHMQRETKGAILYHEVDDAGNALGQHDANIGALYIRKTCFAGASGTWPKRVQITLEVK